MKRHRILRTVNRLSAAIVASVFVGLSAQADAPLEFFCGSDAGASSGFVEAGDTACADGTAAAKVDHGTILCQFNTHCIPATAGVKAALKAASNHEYGDLSDEQRYQIISSLPAFAGVSFPTANVDCRVKSDPCKPQCPSIHDCADPKKSGAVKFLRLLPPDGRAGTGIDAAPGGAVYGNPKNSNGSVL